MDRGKALQATVNAREERLINLLINVVEKGWTYIDANVFTFLTGYQNYSQYRFSVIKNLYEKTFRGDADELYITDTPSGFIISVEESTTLEERTPS